MFDVATGMVGSKMVEGMSDFATGMVRSKMVEGCLLLLLEW